MWDYTHIDEVRRQLLTGNILDLGGDVDEDMAMYVREAVRFLATVGNPEIEIIITSSGGNTIVGLDIYDLIRTYPNTTVGRVESFCRSMAAVILQACDQRQMSVHSQIKIHNIKANGISLDVFRDEGKLRDYVNNLETKQRLVDEIFIQRTGRTLEEVRIQTNKDTDLSAAEALEFGLIDEII